MNEDEAFDFLIDILIAFLNGSHQLGINGSNFINGLITCFWTQAGGCGLKVQEFLSRINVFWKSQQQQPPSGSFRPISRWWCCHHGPPPANQTRKVLSSWSDISFCPPAMMDGILALVGALSTQLECPDHWPHDLYQVIQSITKALTTAREKTAIWNSCSIEEWMMHVQRMSIQRWK